MNSSQPNDDASLSQDGLGAPLKESMMLLEEGFERFGSAPIRYKLDDWAKGFVYRPIHPDQCEALNATVGYKFCHAQRILDEWHIFGGTRWSRTLFRLRHPIVYSKRGLRTLWRRIKRFFFGDPPMIRM